MGQPVFLTPAGSLGVIPEGIFFQVPILAYDPDDPENPDAVYYEMIAGQLPAGIQCTKTGLIEGVPYAISSLQGVPTEVSRDVTSTFVVRAYTEKLVNGVQVIDRLRDRTFSLTVTGQDIPNFTTPPGNVGTFYDGTKISIQIGFTDVDPDERVYVYLASGTLPPGTVVSRQGLISGVIEPLVGPPGTAQAGFDDTPNDTYPNDFTTRSTSKNYQFTLAVTDGKDTNLRTFEIYVYSKDSMSADTTDFTADNTWITADVVPARTPVLLNTAGSLGTVRSDNYYYYKFDAIDFDGDAVEYVVSSGLSTSPPPGLTLDSDTGWLFGYIPNLGLTENNYEFTVSVRKKDYPTIISDPATFTMVVIGNIDTEINWITPPDLGTIDNGQTSMFTVRAVNVGGRSLSYKLVSGSDSKLPQGLTLLPSGNIVGKVSFNTFALDGGTTTFDTLRRTRLVSAPTTFDLTFNFTVNAYAPVTTQLGYQVASVDIVSGGSGYASTPTVVISAPPAGSSSVQATASAVIVAGVVTEIIVDDPGAGYITTPSVSFVGGSPSVAASATVTIEEIDNTNAISVTRTFTITVNRAFNEPYESLYIKCMPPMSDRAIITQLLQNQKIIPQSSLYRKDDPNFGVATNVTYVHAYGLNASTIETYYSSLYENHYWRNVTLGEIRTAQALDSAGKVIYEVVYSLIIDDLLNNQGVSVGKTVTLPYPVDVDGSDVTVVYPNSLPNMRNQVIDVVGQMTPGLPLWMTSKQPSGNVLGFVPCWVIAYVLPGESGRIAYNISTMYNNRLNKVDFKIDRYELDRSQTHNWLPYDDSTQAGTWIPHPPTSTYFDGDTTYFDGRSLTFNSPADIWTSTDVFDKYLLFPKRTILG